MGTSSVMLQVLYRARAVGFHLLAVPVRSVRSVAPWMLSVAMKGHEDGRGAPLSAQVWLRQRLKQEYGQQVAQGSGSREGRPQAQRATSSELAKKE